MQMESAVTSGAASMANSVFDAISTPQLNALNAMNSQITLEKKSIDSQTALISGEFNL